jgi:predicted membrane metal-binding protein
MKKILSCCTNPSLWAVIGILAIVLWLFGILPSADRDHILGLVLLVLLVRVLAYKI